MRTILSLTKPHSWLFAKIYWYYKILLVTYKWFCIFWFILTNNIERIRKTMLESMMQVSCCDCEQMREMHINWFIVVCKLMVTSCNTIHTFCFPFAQKLLGSPDDASLEFLRSDNARRYIRQLPQYRKQKFATRFPNMLPEALDLLEKMLIFDPNKRITGMHSYRVWVSRQVYSFLGKQKKSHLFNVDVVFSFICSWWGTMSPLSFITSQHQWWASLSQAIQFWFWSANMHWRAREGAHLEGISEVQSGSTMPVILSYLYKCNKMNLFPLKYIAVHPSDDLLETAWCSLPCNLAQDQWGYGNKFLMENG